MESLVKIAKSSIKSVGVKGLIFLLISALMIFILPSFISEQLSSLSFLISLPPGVTVEKWTKELKNILFYLSILVCSSSIIQLINLITSLPKTLSFDKEFKHFAWVYRSFLFFELFVTIILFAIFINSVWNEIKINTENAILFAFCSLYVIISHWFLSLLLYPSFAKYVPWLSRRISKMFLK